MPMTAANMFWLETLRDCNLNHALSLPFDRHRLSNEQRTYRATSFCFTFDQHRSHQFLSYVSLNNINPQHLALALYYAFLFKLTNGQRDLSIGMQIDNRYKEELKSIIGLFENIIPLRCELDPHSSFHQLIEQVCDIVTNSMKYSYFPVQRILAQHPNVSKPVFLDTSFDFQSSRKKHKKNDVIISSNRLHPISVSVKGSEDEIISQMDFNVIIEHDMDMDQLSCTINASLDLFHLKTVEKIAHRFHSMLEQLFDTSDVLMNRPLCELSLELSDERLLMQSINNTEVLFPNVTCIHHEFINQVMKHPQQLAVELDEQSLTYAELLYYVQMLSLNLLNIHQIIRGEIVCQCIERSISMVS